MQRKKLLALPIDKDRADVPQMQHIEEVKEHSIWTGEYIVKHYNYCYDAFVDSSTGEDVLILDVFLPAPQSEFKYRLFMTGDKWFTVDDTGKTSERSLYWSVGGYWNRSQKYHPFNDKTDTVIFDYIIKCDRFAVKYDVSGIESVANWQNIIRERRLKNKYNKIKESISREMLEIRPLPKAFYDWIDNVVMADSRYLFYDYNGKKQTTARCSVCGKEVTIPKVKKEDKVTCPHCKKVCRAIPRKAFKNTNGFNDNASVFYLQPFKNDRFCARKFYVRWDYHKNEQPCKYMFEENRTIVEIKFNDLNIQTDYEYDPAYKGGDWRRDYTYSNVPTSGYIFPNTLNKIFKEREGFFKYHINFNKIARICNPTDYTGIFNAVNKVNFFDNLLNNNLIKLAKSFITIFSSHGNSNRADTYNLSAGSLRKGLLITKDDLPNLQIINPDEKELSMYNAYKSTGRKVNTDEIKEYLEISKQIGADEKFMMRILRHSSLNQFIKYFRRLESEGCFKGWKNSYYWNNPYHIFASDYKDYLDLAELLEYDLKDLDVLYPKDLKKAHDQADRIVTDKEFTEGELPQIARQYEKYKELYYFETDDFIITPPTRHKDIKWEGKTLKHCVATYAQRIALGETIILFIRKKSEPGKPYFTLNLDPVDYHIIQCRGLQNCAYPADVKKFMDKWYAEKIKPLKESKKCQNTTAA